MIEEEEQREVVPEEVAPEGDPYLTHEEYLQQQKDLTEGDWRVEYRQGEGVPDAEDKVADHVPGDLEAEVKDYVPGRDNSEVDPDEGS